MATRNSKSRASRVKKLWSKLTPSQKLRLAKAVAQRRSMLQGNGGMKRSAKRSMKMRRAGVVAVSVPAGGEEIIVKPLVPMRSVRRKRSVKRAAGTVKRRRSRRRTVKRVAGKKKASKKRKSSSKKSKSSSKKSSAWACKGWW